MTKVIYEPAGRANEYSPLALNIYSGCSFGCVYCYVPKFIHRDVVDFRTNVSPRADIIQKIEHDAKELSKRGEKRQILLSFTSDPYQPLDSELGLTREALKILSHYGLNFTVLTKAGMAAKRDFDILSSFGSTIVFLDDDIRRRWEPFAANTQSRIAAVKEAHDVGICTWVSLEPVINPDEALSVIRELADYVDMWKVGKINHFEKVEEGVDWSVFLSDVLNLFSELGIDEEMYYIKKDLKNYGGI